MKKKGILVLVLIVAMLFGNSISASAAVPNISTSRYIKTYPLSTQNNTYVYTNSSLRTRGTSYPYRAYNAVIYASDEIYVYSMNNTYAYISYPTSSGRRFGYVKTSALTSRNNDVSSVLTSRANITTYVRAGGAKYGSIAKGDSVYTVASSGNYVQVIYPTGSTYKMGWITTSNYNNYIKSSYNPQGCLDSVTSSANGQITIKGWAFDRDSLGSKLAIHVYVGGPAGSGAPGYAITANTSRPDVNNVYPGVGNNHGFSSNINVTKTGRQTVYVYAINVGGGSNVLIGTKTVDIKSGNGQSGTSSAQIALGVPDYKQYDTRWANQCIGNHTIENIGCLLTSCSMKYSYQTGTTTYPTTMKSKLRFSNNDLIWSSLYNVGFTYTNPYNCNINNSIMSTIYQQLKAGKPVIIGGKSASGGYHYVVVTGYKGSSTTSFKASDFTINDPNSRSRTTLSQFTAAYPKIDRLVY